jgi:hypothetical protein
MEPWRACRSVVAVLPHFDEVQYPDPDQDPHQSEELDPDPHQNRQRDPDLSGPPHHTSIFWILNTGF